MYPSEHHEEECSPAEPIGFILLASRGVKKYEGLSKVHLRVVLCSEAPGEKDNKTTGRTQNQA